MPTIGPGGDVYHRFFILAGLVRHEYWLHNLRPEDYEFQADAESLTLSAKAQREGEAPCIMRLTPETLLEDPYSIARAYFKEHCHGLSAVSRMAQSLKRRSPRVEP